MSGRAGPLLPLGRPRPRLPAVAEEGRRRTENEERKQDQEAAPTSEGVRDEADHEPRDHPGTVDGAGPPGKVSEQDVQKDAQQERVAQSRPSGSEPRRVDLDEAPQEERRQQRHGQVVVQAPGKGFDEGAEERRRYGQEGGFERPSSHPDEESPRGDRSSERETSTH